MLSSSETTPSRKDRNNESPDGGLKSHYNFHLAHSAYMPVSKNYTCTCPSPSVSDP